MEEPRRASMDNKRDSLRTRCSRCQTNNASEVGVVRRCYHHLTMMLAYVSIYMMLATKPLPAQAMQQHWQHSTRWQRCDVMLPELRRDLSHSIDGAWRRVRSCLVRTYFLGDMTQL